VWYRNVVPDACGQLILAFYNIREKLFLINIGIYFGYSSA